MLVVRERLSMSSLFGINLRGSEHIRTKTGGEMTSTRHEQAYHAAHRCQAASLSLTTVRWRGLCWACQVEGQKMQDFWRVLSVISTS